MLPAIICSVSLASELYDGTGQNEDVAYRNLTFEKSIELLLLALHTVQISQGGLRAPMSKVPLSRASTPRHESKRLSDDLSSMGTGTIENEMKQYESKTCNAHANQSHFAIVRLDGHCFSQFTKGFRKPFDMRITNAMIATTIDLMNRFPDAIAAYTFSDEITLYFKAQSVESSALPMFNGRIQKVCSVLAGYASARFNFHLMASNFSESNLDQELRKRAMSCEAHFDARIANLPNEERMAVYTYWRASRDCNRNAVLSLGQHYYSQEEMQHKSIEKLKSILKIEKGVDFEYDMPLAFRFGTFVKRERYQKKGFNPKTQEEVIVNRVRVASRSFKFNVDDAGFLLDRYWDVHA